MSYYIHDWGQGHQSLYEKRGEERHLLAYRGDNGWETRPKEYSRRSRFNWQETEISKEEAVMILFQARKPPWVM